MNEGEMNRRKMDDRARQERERESWKEKRRKRGLRMEEGDEFVM